MNNKNILLTTLFVGAIALQSAFSAPGDKRLDKTISYAEKAYEALDFNEAIKFYEEANSIEPSKDIKLRLADCYQKIHATEKAIKKFEEADELGELSKKEKMNYGNALIDAGRYEEAREVLKDYVDESGWVKKKVNGIESLESFFQYKDAYKVSEVSFNTEQSEFSPTLYEDELVIVASRDQFSLSQKYNWDNSGYLDLYRVSDQNEVVRMSKKLNTRFHEGPAVFFDNDTKVIFTRNQFEGNNSRIPGEVVNHLKLFYAERKPNGKWKNPKMLPFNMEGYSYGHPAFDEEKQELYFASNMENGRGGTDLYKASYDGEDWTSPEPLDNGINTEKDELFPFFQDGTLYFASEGLDGLGGLDIFSVDLENGDSEPRNVGAPINTKDDDFGWVWLANERKGYFSSNREGGTGSDDIYEFSLVEHEVKVSLVDADTHQPILGDIEIIESATQKVLGTSTNAELENVNALRGAKLIVSANAEGDESAEQYFDTKHIDPSLGSAEIKLNLNPLKTTKRLYFVLRSCDKVQQIAINDDGSSIDVSASDEVNESSTSVINNIYYGFDKYTIEEPEVKELDQLVSLLNLSDEVRVKLTGYADPTGSAVYNQKLSEKRVETVRQFLIDKGITDSRIFAEGMGESQSAGNCGEVNYEQLRRTEIEVLIAQ